MAKSTKSTLTPTEEFIQSAAFIWKAVQELDQAASSRHDLGRTARGEFNRLDGLLQDEIRGWNRSLEDYEPPALAVYECSQAGVNGCCGIYTVNAPDEATQRVLCGPCAERLYDRLQDRLQEVA